MIVAEFDSFLVSSTEQINQRLSQLVPIREQLPYSQLFSAARYSLLSPAKRLRPLLVLATAASYEVPIEQALDPACALEMVHTYSLIHDDLPCMDDDDFRRGKPTLHKIYPEAHAVLTGDYLLTLAFEILAQSPALADSEKIHLISSLAQHAGAKGMIGGQVIDLSSENQTIDSETLELMHVYKTASLLIAALEFGAIIAKAPLSDLHLLQTIGRKIGVAFQIVDDILDVVGNFEEMGKKTGSDEHNHKSTALSFKSVEQCWRDAEILLDSSLKDLSTLSKPAPLLTTLFGRLIHRKS